MQKEYTNIGDYINSHIEGEPTYLTELLRETYLKTTHPHMLSGHYQGRLLSFLSNLIQPKKVLEIGTFTGYSTLCLIEGLQDDGVLYTIDHNDELAYFHKKYIETSERASQIKVIIGDAMQEIPKLEEGFDLIFLDADKENYTRYYDLIVPKMKKNSLLIADNTLWYNKVLEQAARDDHATREIKIFNKKVKEDSRVQVIILPVRDGLSLIRKR